MADADVIVVGAGLSGLVAAAELADAGRKVVLLDQEGEQNVGGQAYWSFGGLFMINSPEQRRMGIRDGVELAWQDWLGSAQFDRPDQDRWARAWARAYVDFAAGEKRAWLRGMGHRLFPVVGWAERGDGRAEGHGNSVPRFHITWGTGPGLVELFTRRVHRAAQAGRVELHYRHRVTEILTEGGGVAGVRCDLLEPTREPRGRATSRVVVGERVLRAPLVIVTSGGIGGDHDLVRAAWPDRLGAPPTAMVTGVPAYVDGRLIGAAERAGGRVVNRDRMWHYTEGLRNWDPIWPGHGIRILPGPSSLWLDALGHRLPHPCLPGFDTLGTLRHLRTGGAAAHDHSWFVLTRTVLDKEFTLSGSEQNPDLTGRDLGLLLRRARGGQGPVQAFLDHGEDFLQAEHPRELAARMNALTGADLIDPEALEALIRARDAEITNPFSKDTQVNAIRSARRFLGDRLIRTAAPHRFLDPRHGPLIAVRLHVLTRKTLGGLHTDLSGRVLGASGEPVPGLYAAGEAAGFGGGGMHGYNALEGTFLGGCLFTGRTAGRAAAAATAS